MGCGTLLKSSTRMTAVLAMTLTKVSFAPVPYLFC